jgi:hypothetical protein
VARKRNTQLILTACVALWLIAVIGGMRQLWIYSATPGVEGTPPDRWPDASRLERRPGEPTLVMVIHPHCPCSRSSIGELSALMTRASGRMHAYIVFVRPPGFTADWARTDLWSSAGLIAGVTRILDDGTEGSRFGAATSGQAMLYGADGRLLFSGGITRGRGHYGDNSGVRAIADLLNNPSAPSGATTPVYGCALFGPDSSRAKGKRACLK